MGCMSAKMGLRRLYPGRAKAGVLGGRVVGGAQRPLERLRGSDSSMTAVLCCVASLGVRV